MSEPLPAGWTLADESKSATLPGGWKIDETNEKLPDGWQVEVGATEGIINAGRRAGRGALAGVNVMGALNQRGRGQAYEELAQRYEREAERAEAEGVPPGFERYLGEQARQVAQMIQADGVSTRGSAIANVPGKPGETLRAYAQALRAALPANEANQQESLAAAARHTRAAEAIPISEDYRKYQEAEGWEAVKQFLKNPVELPLTIAAEGAAGSVPTLIAGAAGAVTAGVPGLVAGTGLGSFATDYASTVLETFGEAQVDTEDPAALKAAFADPELMAKARRRGLAHGIPVAVFDALSGGLAGRTVAPVVKQGVRQIVKAGAKEVAQQAGLGMGGEAAGQVAEQITETGTVDGEALKLKDIVAEGIGELVPGAGQTALGAWRRDRRPGKTNLRPPGDDKPATQPAPNPSPAATTGAPADASLTEESRIKNPENRQTADLEAEMAAALPDRESRDVLAGRSAEAAERAVAAPVETDFATTVRSVQDALLAAEATPGQLDALDFQLSVLELQKGRRRPKPEAVNRQLGNTFLMEALPAAEVFPLVSRLAESGENVAQLRAGIAEIRGRRREAGEGRAESPAAARPVLSDEARAAKLAELQAREAEALAARQRAEVEQAAQREAAAKAEVEQRARIKAESAALKAEETTGRDATGRIADLTRVPDAELAALDAAKEGVAPEQIEAELTRRARAEERAAAAEASRGEDLLDVLAELKLPAEDAALGEELRQLVREGMTARQRMTLVKAGKGSLDGLAEALRERGFTWAQTPSDVIDGVQRALRGEKIFAERSGGEMAGDDLRFARRFMGREVPERFEDWLAQYPDEHRAEMVAIHGLEGLRAQHALERQIVTADPGHIQPDTYLPQNVTQPELPFARRSAPTAARTAAERTAAQERWWDNFRLTAPGLARQFELRFGEAADLVDEGVARASDLTGEEQAAYVARRRQAMRAIIYLFDRALRKNTEAVTRLNLLHELGHAYWDTLDMHTQEQLGGLWRREKDTQTGPLFDAAGSLRPDVARGVFDEADMEHAIREWFAERLAHANSEWAARRMGARARGDTLLHQIAAEFRALLNAVREYLARAFGREGYGDAINGDFRKFLDQGARWGEETGGADFARRANQTETPEFKAWFGDSKVVDAEGKPLVVYHGTPTAGFEAFRGLAWFTDSPSKASGYAQQIGENQAVYPVYISIKKPKRVELFAVRSDVEQWLAPGSKHDGIIIDRSIIPGGPHGTFYVVKNPEQIKSAIANRGTFDPNNPRIDFARREAGAGDSWTPEQKQARFEQLRAEFDRVTAEALAIRAEMKPLWESTEKSAEPRLRALNDALTENEGITKKIYKELAELRAELEQANPTKKELPPGVSLEKLVAAENERGEALKRESTEQLLRDYASTERTRDRYLENGDRVPRHVLTALADLREALEESLPGWRDRLARDRAATAADIAQGAAKPTGPEPEAGVTSLFDEGPEIAPDATAAKRSQLEAGTLRRPQPLKQWLANVAEWFGNFASAIPELPGGAKGREFARFRQGWRKMKAATARVRHDAMERIEHIVEPFQALGRDAVAPDRYRELQRLQEIRAEQIAAEKPVKPELKRRIAEIEAELEGVPYHLFRKVVLYRDLFFRSRLEGPGGDPLRLPFGLTQGEVETSLRELHGRVAESPHRGAIEEALRRHYALVKDVRDGLLARGYIIPEELRNPLYFPHLVLDKTSGQLTRVKLDTAEDFRGYLVRLVGSDRAIDTDYVTAMYHHLATVEAHNARQDIVEAHWKPYDILDKLKAEAEEATARNRESGGGPVHWRALVPEGFTVMTVDDRIPVRPDLIINRGVLAQKLGVALGDGDLQARLRELGMSITLTAEDFEQAMTAGEKARWVVPTPIADAMRAIIKRESDTEGVMTRVLSGANGLWKRWTLFAPHNVTRYTYGNLVADMEKLFSADPRVFAELLPAYREVREFFAGGKPSADLRAAFERGVIDSVTANEVTQMTGELGDRFEAFLTRKEKLWQALAWVGRAGVALNRYREATFRYAKYRADLARMRAGAEPVYAGAFARDVRAIEEATPEATMHARAAEISRRTFGDYDDISVSGAGLRKTLIPFYSWMEINFRYHANLFRNLGDMTLGAGMAQVARQTATAASRVLVARSVTGVLLRLALPYVAVALWNNTGDREELEKTLSEEDRRRFHIIIGKDAQGRTIVVYAPTALSDVMKWFGGNDFMRLAGEYGRGEITLPQLAHEWASNAPRDAANNVAQSVGPLYKGVASKFFKRSIFPDVFKPRTIADHDVNWHVLANMVDGTTAEVLRRAVDKDFYSSRDFETWAQQAILQARRRDPEQWGYYATLDKVAEYQAAHRGSVDFGANNRDDARLLQSFRQALRAADVPAAIEFYQRLLETGYTAERFANSVRNADPLHTMKREARKPFVDSLSEIEKEHLRNAYKYSERLKVFQRHEGQLFPRDRATPGYKAKFAAAGGRPDVLAGVMEKFAAESDAEVELRAERLMRESLRPRR